MCYSPIMPNNTAVELDRLSDESKRHAETARKHLDDPVLADSLEAEAAVYNQQAESARRARGE